MTDGEFNPFARRRETLAERQIREARDRGAFDNLEGTGKPIAHLDRPHDDEWWIREKLKRENVSFLPPTLAIRREVDLTREHLAQVSDEAAVRDLLESLNARIRRLNALATDGPPSRVMPLNIDAVVAEWSAQRALTPSESSSQGPSSDKSRSNEEVRPMKWWSIRRFI